MLQDDSGTLCTASPRAERIAILKLNSDQRAQERRARMPPPAEDFRFMIGDQSIEVAESYKYLGSMFYNLAIFPDAMQKSLTYRAAIATSKLHSKARRLAA